jgi:transcriptional regulator with XRE-family HTH domain
MQVSDLIATLARKGFSGYSLSREVEFGAMSDATPTRAQRFRDIVVPAAQRAGYNSYGAKAKFARDTGMTESSVSRMWTGQAIPEPRFFQLIADAVGLHPGVLFVEAGLMSQEALQSLSETDRSQVLSTLTPEDVADHFGINDPVGREMLYATFERLKRLEDEADRPTDHGGTAAQM